MASAQSRQEREAKEDEDRSAEKEKELQKPQTSSRGAGRGQRGGKKDRSLTGTLDASDSMDKAIDAGHQGKSAEIESGKRTKQDVETSLSKIKEERDAVDK